MGSLNVSAQQDATPDASAGAEKRTGGRSVFMVFGLVKFEQKSHMLKASVDSFDNPPFEFCHAFVHRNDGFIDAFVGVNHRSDRADQAENRECDPDNQRQNLRISQLFFLDGIASRSLQL